MYFKDLLFFLVVAYFNFNSKHVLSLQLIKNNLINNNLLDFVFKKIILIEFYNYEYNKWHVITKLIRF